MSYHVESPKINFQGSKVAPEVNLGAPQNATRESNANPNWGFRVQVSLI